VPDLRKNGLGAQNALEHMTQKDSCGAKPPHNPELNYEVGLLYRNPSHPSTGGWKTWGNNGWKFTSTSYLPAMWSFATSIDEWNQFASSLPIRPVSISEFLGKHFLLHPDSDEKDRDQK
jgi:hypothetical protein